MIAILKWILRLNNVSLRLPLQPAEKQLHVFLSNCKNLRNARVTALEFSLLSHIQIAQVPPSPFLTNLKISQRDKGIQIDVHPQ